MIILKMIKINKYIFIAIVVICVVGIALLVPKKLRTPELESSIKEVSVLAVGDIMLSRYVATKSKIAGDYNFPFLKVSEKIRSADIAFGNLESPITPGKEVLINEMVFRTDPEVAVALHDAGFDVLSLANNHMPDFGEKGIKDTVKYLDEASVLHTGAGVNLAEASKPAFIEKGGLVFAFLAYNDPDVVPTYYEASQSSAGTSFMRIENMKKDIAKAKSRSDFVIVSMHSGHEYTIVPNISQTEFAKAAIDAGAEVVIGHHPHVVQPVEQYKGKYIFYSLGNFIFDQANPETKKGLAVELLFDKSGVKEVTEHKVLIENFSQARFVDEY
jgi:poly-gamma-glutamate capsule biosynthesis protein CapA/YwtB (metallophosphatase superfamily)